MTAEIAVMNKSAVALAADSKVTVTSGGTTKTYDTVSKLFTLSKVAPVGVMIYGNAEFMGFPWETIIKMYRNQKGSRTEKSVSDWAQDLFRFLDRFGTISEADKKENVTNLCITVCHDVLSRFNAHAEASGIFTTSPNYQSMLRGYIERRFQSVIKTGPWVQRTTAKALGARLAPSITGIVDSYFDESETDTRKSVLKLLLATLFYKSESPQATGIVVAGFGDLELFPTLTEFFIEGYVGDKIKRFMVPPVIDLSREQTACIRPFAQKEMVQRFMNGIDPSYGAYLQHGVPDLVIDNCFSTLEKYGKVASKNDRVREEIRKAVTDSVNGFEKDAQDFRNIRFSDPVMNMVAVLPKDELAHLAESLVALTSLKRRVSSDTETVGGAIDVALISKGDGFIWIKRKHYFSSELNPQFVRTYMNGVTDGRPGEGNGRYGQRAGRSNYKGDAKGGREAARATEGD